MKTLQHKELTKREEQVLALLLAGFLQRQIGYELGISESRVQDCKQSIRKKWGVVSEIDFFLMALKKGYLDNYLLAEQNFIKYISTSTNGDQVKVTYKSVPRTLK